MHALRLFCTILLFSLFALSSMAQEVSCEVVINSDRIENTDRTIFVDLRQSIFDFINTRKWTGDKFKENEKIEASMLINLSNVTGTRYEASIQITSRRPVYGTTYYTTIWKFKDDNVVFEYDRNAVLEYSESAFLSNLTALLSYYTYMIIAYDYESFSLEGGTPYFQKAQNQAAMAQSSGYKGWSSTEQRNRYWLVEDHLTPRFKGLRRCMYEYHRKGLDQMSENVEEGRKNLASAIGLLFEVHNNYPNSFNMRVFFDSKDDEIINIFKEARREEQDEVIKLLNQIDPANILKYQRIKE